MQLVDQPPESGTFTTTEWSRLAAYRAAVAAGFYSDWDGSAAHTDTGFLEWLPRAAAEDGSYPFTPTERVALDGVRARVAAGGYADDGPAGDGA